MKIAIQARKLQRTLNSDDALAKKYGQRMARTITSRLAVLEEAETLDRVPPRPPERLHLLRGDRNEQFAVDLVHTY